MNKKLLVGIAGAVIVAIGGGAMLLSGGANAAPGKYSYETVEVDKGGVARVITASGAVNPREKVEVGSEVSGKITAIYVDFNDRVKKNQILAQVDPETFQNTLDQNRARQQQSQASVDNARSAIARARLDLETQGKTYERTKVLFNEGATSKADMEQTEQAYKNAQLEVTSQEVSLKSALAGLETARATVQDSITKLERTKIRSPIDGVILSRKVEVGQTVQSSQSVAQFFTVAADLSQIEIEAKVVESDIGGIDAGDPVVFTVDAFPGERFQGSVVQVQQLGAETANVVTYTVVINARNPNGRLLPGMTANVEITADKVTDVLRIDYDATRFQPPKDVLEALNAKSPADGPDQQSGQGGQGAQAGAGGGRALGRQQEQLKEMLKTAGVDDARIEKISTEMRAGMETVMASMRGNQQQPAGGAGIVGGASFGPPPSIQQQQQSSERAARFQQTQEAVFRKNLNAEEYEAVARARSEMQAQKRVTAYTVNAKGELERRQLMLGLSDGENAQVIRGAQEGDAFVVRANATDKPAAKS